MPEVAILAKQYFDMKIKALPVGYIGPAEHHSWWTATKGKGNYFIADVMNAGNVPSKATPLTVKFIEAFNKEYGRTPDAYGFSSAYMGPYVMKDAIERAGSLKSMFFGGEGLFLATLSGTGVVLLQSLPFSRMADRIFQHAPSAGGSRKGEGSILGGIGDLIGGK